MPPKKSKSTSNEMALKDISSNELSTALLSALENDNVITKLATVLSTSMNLLFEKKNDTCTHQIGYHRVRNENYSY